MRTSLFILALAVAANQSGCGDEGIRVALERPEKDEPVLVVWADLAVTAAERRRGLAGRPALSSDDGLLIAMPLATEVCIVNRGVGFDIDAIYADDRGAVVAIERAIMSDDERPRCHPGVLHVLELAAGVAESVRVGDFLVISW